MTIVKVILKTLIAECSSKAYIAIQRAKVKDLMKDIDLLDENLLTAEERPDESSISKLKIRIFSLY
jgi:hypothetical protein